MSGNHCYSVLDVKPLTMAEKTMNRSLLLLGFLLLSCGRAGGTSPSFATYMNPVFPGDHPDPTLSRFGNDYYTTGSSFATTPIIYHSTDLVHWEAVSQPVSNGWTLFGTEPTDGIWGGHLVFHGGKYWHFFGHAAKMYFVTADKPEGPWNSPREVACPASVPGLGMDNSIFIDDDGSWYLLVKNGQSNNWIVQLGEDGQPQGAIYNLCWINPAPAYPYSWAEGPVLWKRNGYYYYSFAIHIYATQRVMRSPVLTGDQASWEFLGNLFNEEDPKKSGSLYRMPNHCSPAVMAADSTWWVVSQSYGIGEWEGLGRQGLLSRVRYDAGGKPAADFPVNEPRSAPAFSSGGIPWMVPKSDFFNSETLNPEWQLLGYSPALPYSLTARPGWIRLTEKNRHNTIVKSDAEHNYSLITRLDFQPEDTTQEAGLRIMTGLQTLHARLSSTVNRQGTKVIRFGFDRTGYESENLIGNVVWLKLVRANHLLNAYFSADGRIWAQVGEPINVSTMDVQQPSYNAFTGNRQGLYVAGGKPADFDLYIYRDAYTPIPAECPANQSGTSRLYFNKGYVLDNLHAGDWALYAGVEFGNAEYDRMPDSLKVTASCATSGGTLEVWLDSLDTGMKIAECAIGNTGSWKTFAQASAPVSPISGRHDVHLKFTGTGSDKLFQLQSFVFTAKVETNGVNSTSGALTPGAFGMEQNFPNPFNGSTTISFSLPSKSEVSLKIFDISGREVASLVDGKRASGEHRVNWIASSVSSGIYLYRMRAGDFSETKKLVLLK
jgi:xylan 1,4-beta-xylosidase